MDGFLPFGVQFLVTSLSRMITQFSPKHGDQVPPFSSVHELLWPWSTAWPICTNQWIWGGLKSWVPTSSLSKISKTVTYLKPLLVTEKWSLECKSNDTCMNHINQTQLLLRSSPTQSQLFLQSRLNQLINLILSNLQIRIMSQRVHPSPSALQTQAPQHTSTTLLLASTHKQNSKQLLTDRWGQGTHP